MLMIAAQFGHTQIVGKLLQFKKIDINLMNNGRNALSSVFACS